MTFATIPANLKPYLQHRILSAEEERSLLIATRSGDRRARERLQRFNLRLLVDMAKAFHEHYPHLDFDELFDACYVGLNKAIDDYDLDQYVRLIAYARWKILNEMQLLAGKVATQGRRFLDQPVEELQLSHDPLPLEQLERQERLTNLRQKRREIWKALRNLPKQIRKLIIWRLLGLTFKELGDRFGFTGQTASNYFKQYFPLFKRALATPTVCTPPRRSLRRLLTRRTPKLRLTTATVRPKRAHREPQSDRTPRICQWPRVLRKISRSASVPITSLRCKLQRPEVNSRSPKSQVAISRRVPQSFLAAATHLFSTVFRLRTIAQPSNSELPSASVGLQEVRGSPGSRLAGSVLSVSGAVPPDSHTIQLSDRPELQQA